MFTAITKTEAGMLTSQLKWYVEGEFNELEVSREDEAEALAHVFADSKVNSVSVVTWVHSHNLPNALPLVRSNCSSLTRYTREGDEIVATPVDIF